MDLLNVFSVHEEREYFFGISVLRGIYWVKMWQEISLGIHVYFELFAIVFK